MEFYSQEQWSPNPASSIHFGKFSRTAFLEKNWWLMFLWIIFKIVTADNGLIFVIFWSAKLVRADQFLPFTLIITKTTDQKKVAHRHSGKKAVLGNFEKSTRKHFCLNLFFKKKRLQYRGFPVNFAEFFKISFFEKPCCNCFWRNPYSLLSCSEVF